MRVKRMQSKVIGSVENGLWVVTADIKKCFNTYQHFEEYIFRHNKKKKTGVASVT